MEIHLIIIYTTHISQSNRQCVYSKVRSVLLWVSASLEDVDAGVCVSYIHAAYIVLIVLVHSHHNKNST